MSLILVPGEPFLCRYNGTESDETQYDEEGKIITSLDEGMDVTFQTEIMSKDYEVFVLAKFDRAMNIFNERQMWFDAKSSIMPSCFDTFELYFEDKNGRKAVRKITDDELYSLDAILVDSLKCDEGFNKTFVTYAGVHVKGCTEPEFTDFMLIIDRFALSDSPIPHYCQPQEVIDFLGVRNNDGTPFEISNATTPSYDVVAKLICQAEEAIEQATRTSWTVKRAVDEIRNTGSVGWAAGASGSPYMGLFQPSAYYSPSSTYFRGVWCQLIHKDAKNIEGNKGDKIEIRWFGDQWRDITDTGSYWMDNAKGAVYIRQWFFQRDASVRVTYRYGRDEVPEDIKRAAILFTAKHILQTSQLYRFLFPDSPESENRWQKVALGFEYDYKSIIKARADQVVIGGL
jgi:hypothetical protein